ncbi:NAD(P)/FAD-dependent oxidoreductase [Thermosulfuriphilus ammonigenes]|uniref:NAD(P)/FAD-dependent oxidoreductase n=1 Tax=Thermosulfuriphilus ammonigenes TaxID=1936021 RepID=A0A6G7PTQ4_9BACT|nr:NAD(P)/FAD-dependent oxidoreductase [Thermosulfuriphilus ammonigenes]MBA2848846.1 NAD(P)H-nitrite reductase large subunit [Thermosulfuriphilus ammonigenes]QIJ71032.1 NAD(P)/FAD-dependent oxidoreductase [Thermosulfuriphilus ammonigenes]
MLKDGEKGAVLQRDKTTYAIVPHVPLGVVTPEFLRKIADIAEKYGAKALKLTSADRIAIVGVAEEDIDRIWEELGVNPGAAVGACVRSIKVCPGTTFCRLGQQDSLGLGAELDRRYHGYNLPAKFKIGVAGCPNQCSETCIKDLGFIGKGKGWTVTVGGCGGARPRLAQTLIEGVSTEEALEIADRIIKFYEKHAKKMDRLGRLIDRIGFEEFKKAILGEEAGEKKVA